MTLVDALRRVLADTFLMYAHAHIAHWNVKGPGFPEYHRFLNDLYDELWEALDGIAEQIRAQDAMVAGTLDSLLTPAERTETPAGSAWASIVAGLIADNDDVLASLRAATDAALAANEQGLVNFLADRLDKHAKHGWMLGASR